jgi:putative DNA primase/helicase
MSDKKAEPFAPIKAPPRKVADNDAAWALISPVPSNAPEPPAKHPKLGAWTERWTYLNEAGELLGYICRFDPAGGKEFRPLALWRPASGGALEWRWQSWTAPRPLYGLDRLAERAKAPVIMCEGEKAADAAARLAPDCVAVTSPNGAKSAKKADWSPLRGRSVCIWPDADEPGTKFAEAVAAELASAGAARIAVITPPKDVGEGWDAANAEQEGWTKEQTASLIASAQPIGGAQKTTGGGKASGEKTRRAPARDGLVALTENCDFWHSPEQVAYVTYPVNDHRENWPVRSKPFQRWLTGQAYRKNGAVPGAQAVEDVLRFLEGKAIEDGPERKPWRRTGEREGNIYIDLGDPLWRVIEIRPGGWSTLDTHDLPCVRAPAMLALPEPVSGEETGELYPFVNVVREEDFKFVLAWLIAALRPRGPYPILLIQGEQGSGKSILSRLLRSVVDPNIAPIRATPKDEEDLLVAATNGHVLALDNVSKIGPEMADALCRVSTGGGFSTRVKYTNSEEHVVWTSNPIIANGIPSLAERPDLASRALIVHLAAIPDDKRKPEDEHFADWARVAPGVLGTICDALARALVNLPKTKLTRSGRMADFVKLIEAAAPALAWIPGSFEQAYSENRADLEGAAFEGDPLAVAIERFLLEAQSGRTWQGSATKLLAQLNSAVCPAAEGNELIVPEGLRRSRSWPQTAQGVGNRLDRVIPLLRSRGIIVERRHSGERTITIAKAQPAGGRS